MSKNLKKQKVIQSASILFFQKGYHATSVRDIAKKASINVSLISYYFNSKQGLFEYAVTEYYEAYLDEIKRTVKKHELLHPMGQLKKLIFTILQFKQDNFHLTCTIQRELSLHSIFVKELTVTYLAKENHILNTLFDEVIKESKKQWRNKYYLFMQLKGMLTTPYVQHHEWKHHVVGDTSSDLFVKQYVQTIYDWLQLMTLDGEKYLLSNDKQREKVGE